MSYDYTCDPTLTAHEIGRRLARDGRPLPAGASPECIRGYYEGTDDEDETPAADILAEITAKHSKSHEASAVVGALHRGEPVWELDTAEYGGDDLLIGEPGETEDEVREDLLAHFELTEWPERWTLRRLTLR